MSESQAASFNMAISFLQRIHECLVSAHTARIGRDYSGYLDALEAFWLEIDARMGKDERKKAEESRELCIEALKRLNDKRFVSDRSVHETFVTFERQLRCTLNAMKMLIPDAEDMESQI